MTHVDQQFGNIIRMYRKERGMTQNELSEKIDLTTRQLMSIENGKSHPKFDTLCRLVEVLNIPPDHIFYPFAEHNDVAIDSFIELYRVCDPEDKQIVLATARTLIELLKNRQDSKSQS